MERTIKLLQKERYRLLYKQTPFMMVANFIAGFALVALLHTGVSQKHLIIWLSTLYLSSCGIILLYFYLKPYFSQASSVPTGYFYYYLPLLFGVIWGATGYFFFTPNSITHFAFLIIFLFGMTAGGLNALSSSWFSYAAFTIPALLPLAINLLILNQTSEDFIWLAITILAFLSALLFFSKNISNAISRSLAIRYENIELLEKLRTQTEASKKANQDKSHFLAAASHDLRQPVHSLSLFTSAIKSEVQTNRGKALIKNIENANDVMLSLLNSLLDISKLDAGVINPQFQNIQLSILMANITEEFTPLAKTNGLQLHWRNCDFQVNTDPVLLSTIIRNLVQNAIRYTRQGKILLACRKRKQKILLQIWDTGVGIAQENQELIFVEFQQLNNPERDQNKGLGLGLAICKRLSQLLKHPLSVKSQVGKGSVFSIELPLLTDLEQNRQKTRPLDKPNTHQNLIIDFKKVVALVIDDNVLALEATSKILESWGCKVIQAESIETVIKLTENLDHKVNIIVADYRLRENTTGSQAIDTFNQLTPYNTTGLLMTGDTDPERLQEASSHGLAVLHKPVKEAQLKIAISKLLRM